MKNIKILSEFLKELEKEKLIEIKFNKDNIDVISNRFLTGQKL